MAEITRIAVLEEFGRPLQIREMEIQDLLPGQILVQIAASGVCGSDVHMQQGKDPRLALPMSLGHEGVGQIVVEVGYCVRHPANPPAAKSRNLLTFPDHRYPIAAVTGVN